MPETVDVEALAKRLARLEVADAAREATWRYALAVDTLDFDLLSDVFTETAVLTTRQGPRQGRDEILAYYRKALADPVGRKHFMVNQRVTHVEADVATLHSYFLYTFAGEDTSILGWGTYDDVVRVVEGVGRIEEKRISIDIHADSRVGWSRQAST